MVSFRPRSLPILTTPPAMTNVAAIILAAGDSTRMGSPKALLDWHDVPLVDHILATARDAGCGSLHVVLGRDAEAIGAGATLEGANVVLNPEPARGQLSSLQVGLSALDFSTDCAVCWPVDVPLVTAADVRALVAAYHGWRASLMRVFVPTFGGERGHPMLVDIGFRQPFLELPPTASARDVIEARAAQVKEVPVTNPGVLVDVDTPQEYENALNAR
jgi:molybdenum cofactor cytidylyltransferase